MIAGYALSRLNFKGAGLLGTAIFVTYLVPGTATALAPDTPEPRQVVVEIARNSAAAGSSSPLPNSTIPRRNVADN